MNKEILRKIGLTEGEIKVYDSLIKLGKSSTGKIMEMSEISSSKVYLILEKLIQKGLVSFIIENNVKKFQITNPKTIMDYIDKKKDELEKTKQDSKNFVLELSKQLGNYEKESAQVYTGYAGMRAALQNLIDELNKNEELLIFGTARNEFQGKTELFIDNFHVKRAEKEIKAKSLLDPSFKNMLNKKFLQKRKIYEARLSKVALPNSIMIGKTRILFTLWEENPIAFELISKRAAQRYREFFYKLWDNSK